MKWSMNMERTLILTVSMQLTHSPQRSLRAKRMFWLLSCGMKAFASGGREKLMMNIRDIIQAKVCFDLNARARAIWGNTETNKWNSFRYGIDDTVDVVVDNNFRCCCCFWFRLFGETRHSGWISCECVGTYGASKAHVSLIQALSSIEPVVHSHAGQNTNSAKIHCYHWSRRR